MAREGVLVVGGELDRSEDGCYRELGDVESLGGEGVLKSMKIGCLTSEEELNNIDCI